MKVICLLTKPRMPSQFEKLFAFTLNFRLWYLFSNQNCSKKPHKTFYFQIQCILQIFWGFIKCDRHATYKFHHNREYDWLVLVIFLCLVSSYSRNAIVDKITGIFGCLMNAIEWQSNGMERDTMLCVCYSCVCMCVYAMSIPFMTRTNFFIMNFIGISPNNQFVRLVFVMYVNHMFLLSFVDVALSLSLPSLPCSLSVCTRIYSWDFVIISI